MLRLWSLLRIIFKCGLVATAMGPTPSLGIWGGQPLDLAFFPYTVHFTGHIDCTGIVIDPSTILTAAHCLDDGSTIVRPDKIRLVDERRHVFSVLTTIKSPSYEPGFAQRPSLEHARSDLALIRVRQNLFERLGIVRLPFLIGPPSIRQDPVRYMMIRGFAPISAKQSAQLSQAAAVVLSQTDGRITTRMIEPGVTTCAGDSGGGAWEYVDHGRFLVGINSVKTRGPCGAENTVSEFVDIIPHLCWIKENAPAAPVSLPAGMECPTATAR